jgi:hypothetical protein
MEHYGIPQDGKRAQFARRYIWPTFLQSFHFVDPNTHFKIKEETGKNGVWFPEDGDRCYKPGWMDGRTD